MVRPISVGSQACEWKALWISLMFLIESGTSLNIGIICCEWLLREQQQESWAIYSCGEIVFLLAVELTGVFSMD